MVLRLIPAYCSKVRCSIWYLLFRQPHVRPHVPFYFRQILFLHQKLLPADLKQGWFFPVFQALFLLRLQSHELVLPKLLDLQGCVSPAKYLLLKHLPVWKYLFVLYPIQEEPLMPVHFPALLLPLFLPAPAMLPVLHSHLHLHFPMLSRRYK